MKLFNSLSGKKEEFHPNTDTVTIYVCGVTVYDDCHIGHAMSYIIFDVIRRYLSYKGYSTKYIQNFTDIDDKIINRAQQLNISSQELAEKYISEYFKDMDALNIQRADIYPRATEEIPNIIEVINGLISKEYAYESKGSVYFRVKRFAEYGKLSHQNTDEMASKASPEAGEKDSPLDFALWKTSKPGEPTWPSPWGEGRPGWHIECSAMALKYLGENIDIHGGGQDLIFPHHENEITQSESFTGKAPFVKYWLHNGLLQLSGDKMSKSLGNLITVKEFLNMADADTIRLFILSSHYRSPLTYTSDSIPSAKSGMERLRQAAKNSDISTNGKSSIDIEGYKLRFTDSMDDDFNTAQALSVLFDLARDINREQDKGFDISEAQDTLTELAGVLGFTFKDPERLPIEYEQLIEVLISVRNELRQAKQWQLADKIRDQLDETGITIEDTPTGTVWKHNR
ncbi:cysteine--tRNA ligase [Chloroflexota bacterium]